MGGQQGEWLSPRFEKLFDSLLYSDLTPKWLKCLRVSGLKLLLTVHGVSVQENHGRQIRAMAPRQLKRIQGMAHSAGRPLPLLFGLSSIEARAAHFQFILGCTSLGLSPERAYMGQTAIAYNHDFPGFLRDYLFVRSSRPQQGIPSVQLTYPTLPGAIAGVNKAGLAVTLNHAFSTEPFNHGVPPTYLVQEALDTCANADEAIDLFAQAIFSCGSMATLADASGHVCALELSRQHFAVRYPENGISLTLNSYQTETLQQIEVPQHAVFHPRKFPEFFRDIKVHGASQTRRQRFESLLQNKKKFSETDLFDLLSDHGDEETEGIGTICRHHVTGDTIAHAVLLPEERKFKVARGFACEADYQEFTVPGC